MLKRAVSLASLTVIITGLVCRGPDLTVTAKGVPVKASLAFGSYAAFRQIGDQATVIGGPGATRLGSAGGDGQALQGRARGPGSVT
jgi:hypothetical protein